ncbi:hypothetical protein MY04_4977 [Flammeovirga sp. MY04]|uniref:OmpL47-type beta-barrel domain-containing protein n=1 Tax=Flammeovirga sp. MY04 TaxID=1191459 RepID=UPI000806415E|nr:hypothetical protein [Flammeovirga sp. MY04]ANQ52312.1 hypothetical protein MY04_4977 [Flammeovirga sp. MY04]
MKTHLLIVLQFFSLALSGQEILNHRQRSHVDSTNKFYQQADLPLYLFVATDINGKDLHQMSIKTNGKFKSEPVFLDGHGVHSFKHFDEIDNVEQRFYVYADGRAPESTLSFFRATKYINNESTIFYGKELVVDLKSEDDMVGVDSIFHSINGIRYLPYEGKINFDKEGDYVFKYYATDKVGNVENVKTKSFIVDHSSPETNYVINGVSVGNTIATNTKLFLETSDSLSGVDDLYYRFNEEEFKSISSKVPLDFSHLEDGDHILEFYAKDNVGNIAEIEKFNFYLDKSAPITAADIIGDRFLVNGKLFFSGRTKLKITAVDNKVGVRDVLYSIDGEDFKSYSDPFYLPSQSGEHIVKFFSIDHLQNRTDAEKDAFLHKVSKFYVDLVGPSLTHQFDGPTFEKEDTIFISNKTKLVLNAKDHESGLQYIAFNKNGQGEEQKYEDAIIIDKEGLHTIDYHGYDNVNNRNTKSVTFMVDTEGPDVFHHFSIDDIGTNSSDKLSLYPHYVSVFLAATDKHTGYKRMFYSINGKQELPYTGVIDGFKRNKKYNIKIRCVDKLDNEKEYNFAFRTVKKKEEAQE